MASTGRRDAAPLIDRLLDEPHRFDFFAAVRAFEVLARRRRSGLGGVPPELASDATPDKEPVRLLAKASLAFPAAEVVEARRTGEEGVPAYELVTTVLGLTGALGTLPVHYTELVVRRQRMNDTALRDFLSVFEHRALSLFHRAWSKYRLVPASELAAGRSRDDAVTAALYAVAGFGTQGLRNRLLVHDPVFVRFGAAFAGLARPVCSLEAMLVDYFGLPAEVEQFRVEILTLELRDRTRLGTPSRGTGVHHVLGDDAVLGRHSADACGRFRVRVGPVDYATYCRFLPGGDLLRPYCQLVRTFVGPSPEFSLRPLLLPLQAPPCALAAEGPEAPRLGWNTWLRSEPLDRLFDGVDLELDPRRDALIETRTRQTARP